MRRIKVASRSSMASWRLQGPSSSAIFAHPAALVFVNRSSLAQTYAARLARAYLGATNPLRQRPEASNVTEVAAGDDVASIRNYMPHLVGGPLHLINVMSWPWWRPSR
jgi:hypothetical protein